MTEEDERPIDPALADMVRRAVRAKVRFVAFSMALAVAGFVWAAREAGQPVWLAAVMGAFGAVLIGLFVALVWFWLRVLGPFNTRPPGDTG